MTVTATYEGTEIARSDRTVVVEGNHYFPAEDVLEGTLQPSDTHSVCPWKGEASYYDVVVGEKRNPDAGVVLPGPQGRGQADRRSGGVLEGRHRRRGLSGTLLSRMR